MRKKVKLNVILLMFLLAVLTVLVVLPVKSKADIMYLMGWLYLDPKWGMQVCECPMAPVSCFCAIRVPLPPDISG
jgi:hypothetical protein